MSQISKRKILISILSGVMLTASFPPGKLDWMAWFALVPLLKCLEKESRSNAFRLGFIAGLAHFLTLIYWVISVLNTYGGLNIIISLGVLILLCLYLSLYLSLFSFLVQYLKGSRFRALMIAGVWVSIEYIRAKLLTGFPWCLLGYSQFRYPILIQIVDTVGVYGLSFLIIAVNAVIYQLLFNNGLIEKKRYSRSEILLVMVMIIITIAYGNYRLSEYNSERKEKKTIAVAIIQGNMDQSVKWDPAYQKETMDKYQRLTHAAYRFKPDLIVWPETAVPFFFQDNTEFTGEVYRIPRESGTQLIFGSPAYMKGNGPARYYNRAYLLSSQGVIGHYDKVHLVPFGEYVPLKKFLPFVHRLVPAAGDFNSGEEIEPLKLPDLPVGVLICYEAIFPELSRAHVKKGAEILVNLTNDAWFGITSAPYQHLIMSLFRAVENRRPLIRAANTGFSAFIDPSGRIIARGDLFNEEVLIAEIKAGNNVLTIYSQYGDLFACIILIICLIKFFHELCYHLFKVKKFDRRRG
ncbi:apolipoprotein N-acyltransferase [Thermodesulfobacteriota bacterium]